MCVRLFVTRPNQRAYSTARYTNIQFDEHIEAEHLSIEKVVHWLFYASKPRAKSVTEKRGYS